MKFGKWSKKDSPEEEEKKSEVASERIGWMDDLWIKDQLLLFGVHNRFKNEFTFTCNEQLWPSEINKKCTFKSNQNISFNEINRGSLVRKDKCHLFWRWPGSISELKNNH